MIENETQIESAFPLMNAYLANISISDMSFSGLGDMDYVFSGVSSTLVSKNASFSDTKMTPLKSLIFCQGCTLELSD